MTAFATSTELSVYLEDDRLAGSARAELLLDLGSGLIRDEVGQVLDYVEDDVAIIDGWRPGVLLPELPVGTVTQVRTGGPDLWETIDAADWRLHLRSGILRRADGRNWGRFVEATYTHGYPVIPSGLKGILLRVVARAVYNPGGVVNERAGEWSAGFALPGIDSAASGLYLTPADERSLDAFRPGR